MIGGGDGGVGVAVDVVWVMGRRWVVKSTSGHKSVVRMGQRVLRMVMMLGILLMRLQLLMFLLLMVLFWWF